MFRRFIAEPPPGDNNSPNLNSYTGRAEELFNLHPSELSTIMELGWENRVFQGTGEVGGPNKRSLLRSLPSYVLDNVFFVAAPSGSDFPANDEGGAKVKLNRNFFKHKFRWEHLMYAYMIENTNVLNVFKKVLFEFFHGEKLGVPTPEIQNFLRNTEELFFRMPPSYSLINLVSDIRPDLEATRRNNYWRMFGMDLNFGKDGQRYKTMNGNTSTYHKAGASNTQFVSVFQGFLQEVWIGIANARNTTGINPTDDAAISNHARQLYDMLNNRRIGGNIAREEFVFVSMLSWFHLALEFDSPIIKALRAEGSRPDQRLAKIASRVGVNTHANSYDFFTMAEALSRILVMIEMGAFNDTSNAFNLYVPTVNNDSNPIAADMRTIITHWSRATNYDLKVRKGMNINQYRQPTQQMVRSKVNGVPTAN